MDSIAEVPMPRPRAIFKRRLSRADFTVWWGLLPAERREVTRLFTPAPEQGERWELAEVLLSPNRETRSCETGRVVVCHAERTGPRAFLRVVRQLEPVAFGEGAVGLG